jgi:BRCT domain type II-containing protein
MTSSAAKLSTSQLSTSPAASTAETLSSAPTNAQTTRESLSSSTVPIPDGPPVPTSSESALIEGSQSQSPPHPTASASSQPETPGPAGAATSSAATSSAAAPAAIVPIFQFEVPYQLSEITADLRARMTVAVAGLLGVDAGAVVLTFAAAVARRATQAGGVLVSVGLRGFNGSVKALEQRLSTDSLNVYMATQGLRQAVVVATGGNTVVAGKDRNKVRTKCSEDCR